MTFGSAHSQDRTIPRLIEDDSGEPGGEVVLNFGVPGYGARELRELLRVRDAIYCVDRVVYLLNSNDFAWRETLYEGADSGLYRMYNRPGWMIPWFVRKAVYRFY